MSSLVEKIFAVHTEKEFSVGDLIRADVDFVFGNDITAPIAIDKFRVLR